MKRLFLVASALLCTGLLMAQKKTVAKPAAKPASALKTATDSLSYAVGMNTALFLKNKGLKQLNAAMITRAIDDVLKGRKTALTEDQMNTVASTQLQKLDRDRVNAVKQQSQAFLDANKKKPGVVALPSGLQYTVLKAGTGPKPAATDRVKVHYHGTLTDGTVFDSSVERGEPVEFNVNGVIPGWVEALQLMPVCSKWRLFVPSDLAYGDRDAGPVIKGGSALVFDVELIAITTPK